MGTQYLLKIEHCQGGWEERYLYEEVLTMVILPSFFQLQTPRLREDCASWGWGSDSHTEPWRKWPGGHPAHMFKWLVGKTERGGEGAGPWAPGRRLPEKASDSCRPEAGKCLREATRGHMHLKQTSREATPESAAPAFLGLGEGYRGLCPS